MDPFKLLIIALLAAVLFNLGRAMLHMIRGNADSAKMVRALTWRVGLSVLVMVLIIVGAALGIIEPHNVYGR